MWREIRDRLADARSDGDSLLPDGGTVTSTGHWLDGTRAGSMLDSEFVRSMPFWLPPFLLMGLFVYGAIAWNVIISLTDFASLRPPEYNIATFDFEMYTKMFNDPNFWTAFQNTAVLMVVFTVLCLAVGLLLAIFVDQKIRYENTFRTIYLLPFSLSFVVTGLLWTWMYNPSEGAINLLLRAVGLNALTHDWIGDASLVLGAVIVALIWQFSGYAMVIYLAGLRAIPTDQYEAAKMDGASTLKMYLRIIIPQLRASTVGAAVVLMVFSLKAFDFLYTMFGKNPGPGADILSTMMYRQAFGQNSWAYGSAIAVVLFALALLIIAPYLYSQYRRGAL